MRIDRRSSEAVFFLECASDVAADAFRDLAETLRRLPLDEIAEDDE